VTRAHTDYLVRDDADLATDKAAENNRMHISGACGLRPPQRNA
jgi:hypothetical protein